MTNRRITASDRNIGSYHQVTSGIHRAASVHTSGSIGAHHRAAVSIFRIRTHHRSVDAHHPYIAAGYIFVMPLSGASLLRRCRTPRRYSSSGSGFAAYPAAVPGGFSRRFASLTPCVSPPAPLAMRVAR